MSDLWSHSHDWDNGYAVGHKDGYQRGREDAIDECLHAIGRFGLDWEYGRGVKDCYEAIQKIKEQKND